MTATQPLRLDQTPAPDPNTADATAMGLLNHLRLVALECRSAARTDLFEACALLSTDKETSANAFSAALIKSLPQALGLRPRLLRPGVQELSFDERWLVALLTAARAGDDDSFTFLLRSRVRSEAQRNMGYLIASCALKCG